MRHRGVLLGSVSILFYLFITGSLMTLTLHSLDHVDLLRREVNCTTAADLDATSAT